MSGLEQAVIFQCKGQNLVGILHRAAKYDVPPKTGLLIVVGGPQYRIGSHRQFTLLAREVAKQGFPVFRFDYRSMGDSDGDGVSFESVDEDVKAAIDTYLALVPDVTQVVIWGLCDAASVSLFYAYSDSRVKGLVLLNPWVRTEAGMAKAYLKGYYLKRIFSRELWSKIASGKFGFRSSISSLYDLLAKISKQQKIENRSQVSTIDLNLPFPERMAQGFALFKGRILFILSGNNDYVSEEFKMLTRESEKWKSLMAREGVVKKDFVEANHTFSRHDWRGQVEQWTIDWLKSL